jgi:xanthine dehydrogenase molybdopterin-binding subunit B
MTPITEIPERLAAVTGKMRFGSDLSPRRDALTVHVVRSPFARATIDATDVSQSLAVPGVRAVLLATDVNDNFALHPKAGGEGLAILADGQVEYYGQPIALIVAESSKSAAAGAAAFQVAYQPKPPILTIEEAIEVGRLHSKMEEFERGSVAEALESAEHRLSGIFSAGSQDPQWPEVPTAKAEPDGLGGLKIFTGCGRPAELQAKLAKAVGLPMSMIRVETPPNHAAENTHLPAALAALAAVRTGASVSVEYDAEESRILRGHRPAVSVSFEAGHNYEGKIVALDITMSVDLGSFADPADGFFTSILHHIDNAYWLPNIRLTVQFLKTNLPPRTPQFGGAAVHAIFTIEEIVGRVARSLGVMPEVVRQRNFYHAEGMATSTPAGLFVEAGTQLLPVWKRILTSANFTTRRKTVDVWNQRNQFAKRGLAATPVKVALGDPDLRPVASSALVHILPDASVQIFADANGGAQIEALRACASEELGVPAHMVRVLPASTDQASPIRVGDLTFPQLGTQAVRHACRQLRERLLPLAVQVFQQNGAASVSLNDVTFIPGRIASRSNPNLGFSFENFVRFAVARHVDMSAGGSAFIDEEARPYHNFIYGAAVSEVQVDSFTGEVQVLRSDLLHQAGGSDTAASRLRSAFLEGLGWHITEISALSDDGKPLDQLSHAQVHYSLSPCIADAPLDFRVEVMDAPERAGDIWVGGYGLALSIREALKDAIASFGVGKSGALIELAVPATPEVVFRQIHNQRMAAAKAKG